MPGCNPPGKSSPLPSIQPFEIRCPFTLNHEVALVTGGGTGLGLGIARCLAASGARVVITGRRADVLAEAVRAIGEAAAFVVHDVTDTAAAPALLERIRREVGEVTILVNNAGNHLKKPALETSEAEFMSVLNTHVLGAFALTRAAAPAMIARGHGSVLFTASMATIMGIPNVVAYSAAKSAYGGMVRALATELSPHGVRVNAIAPGWIESDMTAKAMAGDPERRRKILERTTMKRFGQAEDIGWAAVYLCSEAARFITGAILPVDGGISIGF